MGKYDFDKIINRKGTFSTKWEAPHLIGGSQMIPLWIADMDFPCAEPIVKALGERINNPIFGYTIYDNDNVKNAVTNWYQKRYGWTVEKDNIFFSPGIIPALGILINTMTSPGDGIIIQTPVYHPFAMKIKANDRQVINNPLINKNNYYEMDYEDLDKKLADPGNKGIILCNPHNPVGRVWKEEELRKLIDLAKKHSKWIISDEIHADIVRKGVKFTPAEKIAPEYAEEIITLTAPSKPFNIAGFKISNNVINKKEYQEKYVNLAGDRLGIMGVSPLAVAALIAAYNEGEEWLAEVNEYIDSNLKYCAEFFKNNLPKSVSIYNEGTYLFWVDLRGYIEDPEELNNLLINDAKVTLNDGALFGEDGAGFQRINVACPRSVLAECLDRMKAALEK